MTLDAISPPPPPEATVPAGAAEIGAEDADAQAVAGLQELIPQPGSLTLPIRVPVVVDWSGVYMRAEVLGSTDNILLLQGTEGHLPPLGSPIRLRSLWDRQTLTGRLAAHGVAGRFLVSLGERAIRRSRRVPVNLAGTARSANRQLVAGVRVTDLSSGGARVEGIAVPVGSDLDLHFTPPGRPAPVNVRGFVVRSIADVEVPAVGVAFRLVQPSMDALGPS